MSVPRFEDDVFADPETHEPVSRATDEQLASVREAIDAGSARRRDGGALPAELTGAYVGRGGRWLYPDEQGLVSFVIESRIELDSPV